MPTFFVRFKLLFCTAFALSCFAANSVLNRLALGGGKIDAASYTAIRLVSGAIALWGIHSIASGSWRVPDPNRRSDRSNTFSAPFFLFLYGIAFSYAYLSLSVGMGAFLLFGTVQTTMLGTSLFRGERPTLAEWAGLAIAIGGLAYLVLPGQSAPDPLGAALMVTAGVAWGLYTLRGKASQQPPLQTTAQNFLYAVPMVLVLCLFLLPNMHATAEGAAYALLSGAIASGVGYVVWYAALKGLTITQAALLQLLVPIIAAFAGAMLLSEPLTLRLAVSGFLITAGIAAALLGKRWKAA